MHVTNGRDFLTLIFIDKVFFISSKTQGGVEHSSFENYWRDPQDSHWFPYFSLITLKVLSSEMDSAGGGIICKIFIKGRGPDEIFCRSRKSCDTIPLKVLSGGMDPAQIRLIPKIFIKGSVAEVFLDKSAHPPLSESPLTQGRHLVQ